MRSIARPTQAPTGSMRWRSVATLAGLLAVLSCSVLTDFEGLARGGADGGSDPHTDATSNQDAGQPDRLDTGIPASELPPTSAWEQFETRAVSAGAREFRGSIFDGRYLYLVPAFSDMLRYDTQKPFADPSSWESARLSNLHGTRATRFAGAAFDGTYVYLSGYDDQARFNTTLGLGISDARAWEFYTVDAVGGSALPNVLWDGNEHVLYFKEAAPVFYLFDRQGSFTDATSWSRVTVPGVSSSVTLRGAVLNGRLVLAQSDHSMREHAADAGLDAGWRDYNAGGFHGGVGGSLGFAWDGRYGYFIPTSGDIAVRVEPEKPLLGSSAWAFAPYPVADGEHQSAAGYDGRYVYYAPSPRDAGAMHLYRLDTQGAFHEAKAWSSLDMQSLLRTSGGIFDINSTAFDGRFLYLIPKDRGIVMRAEVANPPRPVPASNAWMSY